MNLFGILVKRSTDSVVSVKNLFLLGLETKRYNSLLPLYLPHDETISHFGAFAYFDPGESLDSKFFIKF